jgi:hypothetical protein
LGAALGFGVAAGTAAPVGALAGVATALAGAAGVVRAPVAAGLVELEAAAPQPAMTRATATAPTLDSAAGRSRRLGLSAVAGRKSATRPRLLARRGLARAGARRVVGASSPSTGTTNMRIIRRIMGSSLLSCSLERPQ